ncbi:hypothetical protein SAPIO_CDS6539 [Scedosporium apiospermum]|uniref:Bulb-type lectin domain-containing protein n=1 Tax=Pseudallescheria apiosperma TaxID=563466 RepID=A0A084G3Q2_PSEDA|nr:uncharacterized protein SAPIO_CDS6539 [Scedosporium apiospermum]KEZ41964.1 hypothetical protein SAPIO_CDS6539 [Scedosporium apiospermum]
MSHSTLGNGEWLYPGQCLVKQVWDVKGLKMQGDGNLVIYDNGDKPFWSTGTTLRSGGDKVVLTVQNDGNAVLYKGEALWGSNSMKNN